jgi:hypothetical protein
MNKEEQQKLKDALAEVTEVLEDETLSAEQREEFETHAAKISGVLSSTWLPVGWGRRLIMVGIVALGLQQAVMEANFQPFLWWLLLPFFSPRITGEVVHFWGRVAGGFSK